MNEHLEEIVRILAEIAVERHFQQQVVLPNANLDSCVQSPGKRKAEK